jgi:hypothetical protein
MHLVNRSALLVKPAQPFLDWLQRVDPTSAQLTLEDLAREPTIYPLPEWETEEEARKHLAVVSSEAFEEQLNGWYRVVRSQNQIACGINGLRTRNQRRYIVLRLTLQQEVACSAEAPSTSLGPG